MSGGSILKFTDVTFEYIPDKPILEEVSFSVRRGAKLTLMGQNGAGKSTIFKIITGAHSPEWGTVNVTGNAKVAVSKQVIPREDLELTVREFFQKCFKETLYAIDPKIDDVLEVVNLKADKEKKIKDFSGGQQARLLLASALIQEADVLLLDEPTNNLDSAGIAHLTNFLKTYDKTCIVISHDADFLNAFTEGVLYLDVHTKKVEQYIGDYFKVVKEISARIAKEQRENARLAKEIQAKKDKANFFANKGGRLRAVAKQMREDAAEYESSKIIVRKEDRPIRKFEISVKNDLSGPVLTIDSFERLGKKGQVVTQEANISLLKGQKMIIEGPNGIGKSTFLERLAVGEAVGSTIADGVTVGYYRQDFSNLDFEKTVRQELIEAMDHHDEEHFRSVAAGFQITGEYVNAKIKELSEGQKGLVALARLVLLQPGLLIMDEPTNHMNFRHVPVLAKALENYQGVLILVSHVPDFVEKITIDSRLNFAKGL